MYKALVSFCSNELDIKQGDILASDFASADTIADLLEAEYIEEYTIPPVYTYKGTVSTYANLPSTNLTVGDVYNIETADSTHGIKAGDNVAWNGTTWDKLGGDIDLSGYQPLLTAGTNITIDNNVISASGGARTVDFSEYDEDVASLLTDMYDNDIATMFIHAENFGTNEDYTGDMLVEINSDGDGANCYYGDKVTSFELTTDDETGDSIIVYGTTETVATTSDLSSKQDIMQFSTMPTADSTTVGKIIQYTGTTDSTYTNGYFYIGTTDGAVTPTYGWNNINVQGGGNLSNYYTKTEIDEKTHIMFDIKPTNTLTLDISSDTYTTFSVKATSGLSEADRTKMKYCIDNNKPFYIRLCIDSRKDNGGTSYGSFGHYITLRSSYLNPSGNSTMVVDNMPMTIANNTHGFVQGYAYIRFNENANTFSQFYIYLRVLDFLSLGETRSYTPTSDYNPATKKYVDDSITAAITTTLGGSY